MKEQDSGRVRKHFGCRVELVFSASCLPRLFVLAALIIPPATTALAQGAFESRFGTLPDGRPVFEYTLRSRTGGEAKVISFGAALRSLRLPRRDRGQVDVVLGYDSLAEYLSGRAYFGATIGRYANRIAQAQFDLDGHTYHLTANNGENTLHGGASGFNRGLWIRDEVAAASNSVRLRYESAAGEEGFPGRLSVWVTYALTDANELKISYEARTSEPTIVNFTNHTYFNLGGAGVREVLGERIAVRASFYTPVDAAGIPTGAVEKVEGTDFDFRQAATLETHLRSTRDPSVAKSGGYDVNLVLDRGHGLRKVAWVQDPASGLSMEVSTTEPALQLFTPNFPAGKLIGKANRDYGGHAAICLETQHFPNSPHFAQFPSTVLRPGQRFHSETVYKFSTGQKN